jgi:oligo-1,6-glucosidase
MNREVMSHYDCATVGEGAFVPIEKAPLYTADDRHELNMLFLFDHFGLGRGDGKYAHGEFRLAKLKNIVQKWDASLGHSGWNAPFIETGDMPRVVSAWGNDRELRAPSAKMLATFLLTLRGTPYIYAGQELGMTNAHFTSLDDFRDLGARQFIEEMRTKKVSDSEILERLNAFGRDNARTPMQWDDTKNAGFSTADQTWIKVNANYPQINVKQSERDPNSVLQYYRKMIGLRKSTPALVYGEYSSLREKDENVFSYIRTLDNQRFLVVLNFKGQAVNFSLPRQVSLREAKLLIANYDVAGPANSRHLSLRPYEARVYRLQ